MTLQQVADAVGCTKAYIWELEKKPGQRPSAERIQAIAKVLGVTMGDLMGEPVEEVPQASPDDVAFFREYAGMTDEEKQRYRQALEDHVPRQAQGRRQEVTAEVLTPPRAAYNIIKWMRAWPRR